MSSNKSKRWFSQGCQTPRLQILRIDREGVIDDLISHGIWRHLFKKYSLTRSSRICDVSHYCVSLGTLQWHYKPYWSLWGNVQCQQYLKKLKRCKIFKSLRSEIRVLRLQLNGKLRWISGRFHALIWRPGDTVQNPESPKLSRRVDSTVFLLNETTRKLLSNK